MASGRAVLPSGLHRHQHVGQPRGCIALLQWQRHCRAVDQRGQVRAELDTAVLPPLRGQPGASVAVHPFDMLRTAWPTTLGTSCADYLSPTRSSTGRCEASRSSSSRSEAGWCATPGGWCSSWPRWQCRERCSRGCWTVSAGYVRCPAEGRFSQEGGGGSWGAEFPLRGLKKSVAGRNDDQDEQEEWSTTGIVCTVGDPGH